MSRGSLTILACTLGLGLLPAVLPGAALASAPGGGAPHRLPGPPPHRSAPPVPTPRVAPARDERVSLLYVLNAAGGTLTPKAGAAGRYTLSLHDLDRHSVWFSDRPARRSGAFPSSGFAAAWSGFGFAADPPNAALVYTDPATGRERTVILELTHPVYRPGHALIFQASLVDPSRAGRDLSAHARSADREPASRLGDPSLFVDDTSAPVIGSCVLQPYTQCPEANLSNTNLQGVDIRGALLEGANLSNDNLVGAELSYAVMVKANLYGDDLGGDDLKSAFLEGANLSNDNLVGAEMSHAVLFKASLDGADLEGANMEWNFDAEAGMVGANLLHANLSHSEVYDSHLEDASLYEANLSYSNFEGANFTNGTLEGATMEETNINGTWLGGCSIAYVRW